MLNLQKAIGRSYYSTRTRTGTTSINFERVVGSIKVVYSEADEDDDEDGEKDGDGGDSWCADGVSGERRCWEDPFRDGGGDGDVEAAGTASMSDMSFRTGSSVVC